MKVSFHDDEFSKKRVEALELKAGSYTKKLLKIKKTKSTKVGEYALYVAEDAVYQRSVAKALTYFGTVKHVVLIGIGGSSLGTEAIYHALSTKLSPVLSVFDSIDQEALKRIEEILHMTHHPKNLAIVVVSKSGGTVETLTNAEKVIELCTEKFGIDIRKRCIFVGDKGTPFLKNGKKQGITCIPMPEAIGGRFSVFTAVGIVPLTLLGIDVDALRDGVREAVSPQSLKMIEERAVTLALHALKGVHTVNFFTFNKRLRCCGDWYRQLLAESIGKNMTTKGASFQHQLLPIVSSAVDLHSMAQLYLSGYKDLYTLFVFYADQEPHHLSSKGWLLDHVPYLKGKSTHEVESAIVHGVLSAYVDQKLPHRVMELPRCSAREIGHLLGSFMAEVLYLAYLLDVDPFNQPHVEAYKKYTRAALAV